MGCWNQTCAISNLPITCSEDVYAIFSVYGNTTDRLLSTGNILPLYIQGEYNDYGSVESIDENHITKLITDKVRKVFSKDLRDPDVVVDDMTIDNIVSDYGCECIVHGKKGILRHLQIRKQVADSILEQYMWKSWNQTHEGFTSFSRIMEDFDQFYEVLVSSGLYDYKYDDALETNLIRNMFDASDSIRYNRVLSLQPVYIVAYAKAYTREEVYELVKNAMVVLVLDRFMRATNRTWVMPGHAGQDDCTEAHTLLANIVIAESEYFGRRWEEEEETDE